MKVPPIEAPPIEQAIDPWFAILTNGIAAVRTLTKAAVALRLPLEPSR